MSLLPIMIWLNIPFSPPQSPYRVYGMGQYAVARSIRKKISRLPPPWLGIARNGLYPFDPTVGPGYVWPVISSTTKIMT
jgi:hypothetical protein